MANPYQSVGDYLQFIRDKYNVQICVKDFGGFTHINKDLSEALDPFRTDFLAGLALWDEGAIPWSSDRAELDALGEEVLAGMEDLSGRQAQKLGEVYAQALE